jgi:hypothetical protein
MPGAPDHLQRALTRIVSSPSGVASNRRIEGLAITSAEAIQNIESPGSKPAFIVLDDGCECYPTHAVIRATTGLGRSALRGPRNDLIKLLNGNIARGSRIMWPTTLGGQIAVGRRDPS